MEDIKPTEDELRELGFDELIQEAFSTTKKTPLPNVLKPHVSKLSEEERHARRVLKRHKRARAAERRTARSKGSTAWIRQAKAATRARRAGGS